MRGWTLIPDRAGYAEVALTQLGKEIEPTDPWRVVVIDTSEHGVNVDGARVELDPASRLRQRQLQLGETISLSLVDDGDLNFKVGLIGTTGAAPRQPAREAGDEAAPPPEAKAPSAAAFSHPMTAAQAVAAAATEGLTLERANSASGFRFVQTLRDSYRVQLFHDGEVHSLGSFPTPDEAALCVARWKRDHPAADEALAAAAYVQTVSEEAASGTVAEAATMEALAARHRVRRSAQRPLTAPGLATRSKWQLSANCSSPLADGHSQSAVCASASRAARASSRPGSLAPLFSAEVVPAAQTDSLEAAAAAPLTATMEGLVAATVLSAVHQHRMTAAEAVAAAAAEGLALVRADNASGFRQVSCPKKSNKYVANHHHNGKSHYLGCFHTPEEAALCVARWHREHVPADQITLAAAAAAASPPHPMTAAEAIAAAAAEGLALESADNTTGFRHVSYHTQSNQYHAGINHSGKREYLGYFKMPEEAALRVARWFRDHAPSDEIALASAAAAAAAAPPLHPMTATEAIAAAAAEGLALESANSATGFRHVFYQKRDNRYQAQHRHNGALYYLGSFHTPEEAALRVAGWLRDHALAHKDALATAATVPGEEAAAAALAAAEEGVLSCLSRSLNRAAAEEEPTLPDTAARAAAAPAEALLHLAGRAHQCITGRKRTHDQAAHGSASDLAPGSCGLEDERGQPDNKAVSDADAEVEVEEAMHDDDDSSPHTPVPEVLPAMAASSSAARSSAALPGDEVEVRG